MKILGIDTSTQVLATVVIQDGNLLAKMESSGQHKHSRDILPLADKVLKKSGLSLKQIDLIAAGVGPGSFTGLRVGHAFVKGLCMMERIPVLPFSSMELLAWNLPKTKKKIAVILDARREKFYYAVYQRNGDTFETLQDVSLQSIEEVTVSLQKESPVVVTGDALKRYRAPIEKVLPGPDWILPPRDWEVKAVHLASLLLARKKWESIPSIELLPLYLRQTEAEEKWKGKEA